MTIDWRRWSVADDLQLEGSSIRVSFLDRRSQVVNVEEVPRYGGIRLWAVAARPAVTCQLEDPDLYAWERNRGSDLVGFTVDRRGRLVGEVWLPACGLERAEWQHSVRLVAERCDRMEYLLTGKNVD